jgi:uncharacterized delta-60 repeat protein
VVVPGSDEEPEPEAPAPEAGPALRGEPDPSFGERGFRAHSHAAGEHRIAGLALLRDGSIAAAGHAPFGGGVDVCVVVFRPDGSVDASFGKNGVARIGNRRGFGRAVAVDARGRLVVAAYFYEKSNVQTLLARLERNGALDPSFGQGGLVVHDGADDDRASGVFVQPGGRIVLVGYHAGAENQAVGFNPNGSVDASYGEMGTMLFGPETRGRAFATTATMAKDGGIVAAGYTPQNGFGFVTRLTREGRYDTRFGKYGTVTLSEPRVSSAWAVGIDREDRVLFGAHTADGRAIVARFRSDGTLDPAWGDGGIAQVAADGDDQLYAIQVDASGAVMGAGFRGLASEAALLLARFDPRGRLDPSFGSGGVVTQKLGGGTFLFDALLDREGRLVAAGQVMSPAGDAFLISRWR